MHLDDLDKSQIVLLVLLVSFVTSIATGIVTVTLMQQMPTGVTQTVNRVVEHTIERVVPGEVRTTTVVKEVPVLITQEQIIADLVQASSPAVAVLTDERGNALGSAFLISADGRAISATAVTSELSASKKFLLVLARGQKVAATLLKIDPASKLVLLQADQAALASLALTSETASTTPRVWTTLELTESDGLPGQTVVALGASSQGSVDVAGGIISSVSGSLASSSAPVWLKTNAVSQNNLGGPLLNTKGKVAGVNVMPGVAVSGLSLAAWLKQI